MTFRPGRIPNRKRALYALGMLMFFGIGLLTFIIAMNEQSVLGSGRPETDRMSLQDLITKGASGNKHIELADFYFGKQFIYASKLVQFQDVYVPVFAKGQPEDGAHLQLLVWIRNDRNSNQGLIQSYQEVDELVADYNRNPRTISGVLVRPIDRVKALTVDAYPGTNAAALQVLWARDFPNQDSVLILWGVMVLSLVAAGACLVAFRRTGKPQARTYAARPLKPENHMPLDADITAGPPAWRPSRARMPPDTPSLIAVPPQIPSPRECC